MVSHSWLCKQNTEKMQMDLYDFFFQQENIFKNLHSGLRRDGGRRQTGLLI